MKHVFIIGTILLFTFTTCLYAQNNHLSYYIQRSLENSPLLKDYQNQLVVNQIDSLILRTTYQPTVDFSSTNFWAPIVNGVGYDESITHLGRNTALLTVRQTIIGQGNLKTRLNSYTLENQTVQNAKTISEQDLKLAVTTQFITTYGILEEIQFNEELENFLKKEEVILKKLTEKSIYKITDYLNFQVTLQQQQLLITQQKAAYKNNLALLNYLCGIVDTSFVYLEKPDIMLQPVLSFENTLQYHNFQIDSLKIQNRSALIDYSYRPKLDLFVDAGFLSTLSNYTYKHFGASVGFSLTIPIYDGGQRQQQYNKLKLTEQTRKNYQDFSRNQYRQKLDQLYQQLDETGKLVIQTQTVIKSTQTLMDAYGKQMQTGDAHVTDYILSIQHLMNAQHIINQHTNHKLQIINQINYWNHE
jgi:outer membrane protein TolC